MVCLLSLYTMFVCRLLFCSYVRSLVFALDCFAFWPFGGPLKLAMRYYEFIKCCFHFLTLLYQCFL